MINALFRFTFPLALALLAAAPTTSSADPFKLMSADDVERLVGKPGVYVFDVNTPERFQQGRLPGATHVSQDTVAERLPPSKEATLIFYCTNPK